MSCDELLWTTDRVPTFEQPRHLEMQTLRSKHHLSSHSTNQHQPTKSYQIQFTALLPVKRPWLRIEFVRALTDGGHHRGHHARFEAPHGGGEQNEVEVS